MKWVDAGAPQGNPADMPPPQTFRPEDEWHIGKPDLVVKMDGTAQDVREGSGLVDRLLRRVDLTEDRWIKAMEIRPGNRKHRASRRDATRSSPMRRQARPKAASTLHEYAVGKYGDTFTDNTGRLLKKGSRLRFDMHYFAIGEELTDQTEMAIMFYPKGYVPKYNVRSHLVPQSAERRAGDSAEYGRAPRRILPAEAAGPHRRVPAAHAHARQGDDARSDQCRTTRSRC